MQTIDFFRLINTEENLRKEQNQLQTVVSEKQRIIDNQERRIQALDAANNRLLGALNQLKERYHGNQTQLNGHIGMNNKLTLQTMENGQYKSSNCWIVGKKCNYRLLKTVLVSRQKCCVSTENVVSQQKCWNWKMSIWCQLKSAISGYFIVSDYIGVIYGYFNVFLLELCVG